MDTFRLTLLESDKEVVNAFNNYFNPMGIKTWWATGYKAVTDSCLDGNTKCIIISDRNPSIMTVEELLRSFQKKLAIPIIIMEEGPTLKITRYKNGETPSSIHCSNRLKKTDAETWKVIWDEIQKLVT